MNLFAVVGNALFPKQLKLTPRLHANVITALNQNVRNNAKTMK